MNYISGSFFSQVRYESGSSSFQISMLTVDHRCSPMTLGIYCIGNNNSDLINA